MTNRDKRDERERDLQQVDWSKLPEPQNDGAADHLQGTRLPSLALEATDGRHVDLSGLHCTTVVFAYPRTGSPDQELPDGWDMIPGARGCTPQACAFRDNYAGLRSAGADQVFGLSTQASAYQQEAVERLHLPYPLLSDEKLNLTTRLNLPTMEVEQMTLLKRLTLCIRDGVVEKTFYPVFPPDRAADDVLSWLKAE